MASKERMVSAFSVYSMKAKKSNSNPLKKKKKIRLQALQSLRNDEVEKSEGSKKKRKKRKHTDTVLSMNETSSSFQDEVKPNRQKKKSKKVVVNDSVTPCTSSSNSSLANTSHAHSHGAVKKKKSQKCKKRKVANDDEQNESFGNSTELFSTSLDLSDSINSDLDKVFHSNPCDDSKSLFRWLIYPLDVAEFFKNNWEQTPVHINRNKPKYYKQKQSLISTSMIDEILRENYVLFSKNIDITSYINGVRETHNPIGRALPSVVWDYYQNDCSIRLLNPQTFVPILHNLNATLQEFFGCFVGTNIYLTPPNSQGFAPHYDDIEAFILQIEGKKRWKLYKPRNENEYLARYSSKNFDPSEIGEPIMDTIVNTGDLLYFPRGTIHQAETVDDTHSLHITLSVYQKNCWGDFLEKLLPEALKQAINSNSELRTGLPLDYLSYVGSVYSDSNSNERKQFLHKVKNLVTRVLSHIDIDKAADEMAKGHIHDFLPPVLYPEEMQCSILEDGERMDENGQVVNQVEIEPDTKIRLVRQHCIRLMEEEETARVYFSCENSKEYHEYELQFLEISAELAPAVKEIILCYPNFIRVEDLPIEGLDNKIQVAKDLWERCIIITEEPLSIEA